MKYNKLVILVLWRGFRSPWLWLMVMTPVVVTINDAVVTINDAVGATGGDSFTKNERLSF